jgi:type II secretory pathway pseudopilin PulG
MRGIEMFFRKGAMFGLDARIALAIFGALSLISGASLYSAIEDSKNTATVQSLLEVEKAIEAYMLDLGEMADYSEDADIMELSCLVDNYGNCSAPARLWKGPYLDGKSSSGVYWALNTTVLRDSELDDVLEAFRFAGSTWTGTDADLPASCSGRDCFIYLAYGDEYTSGGRGNASTVAKINSLYTRLDKYVDNGDGARAGKIRKGAQPFGGVAVYIKTGISERKAP